MDEGERITLRLERENLEAIDAFLVGNGEVYNHEHVRSRLEGREILTSSDNEVALHLIDLWGPEALRGLNGMFAFAIWDSCARRLLLARDRLGMIRLLGATPHGFGSDMSGAAVARDTSLVQTGRVAPASGDCSGVGSGPARSVLRSGADRTIGPCGPAGPTTATRMDKFTEMMLAQTGLIAMIGKELGLFTDPYQWFGRLNDEQLRAMRLVVDTGLHHKGWTREQAIQYMTDNSALADTDIVSEVERYIVMPGQALGYKIGQLEMTRLRAEAEAALGNKFDVKAFHRVLLTDGALQMKAAFLVQNDSDVPEGKKSTDTQTSVTLVYSL